MIITTSSFSNSGKKLANETSTELWDWDKLQKCICDTYLEGKDYYSYFGDSSKEEVSEKKFSFEFEKAVIGTAKGVGDCTLVFVKMTNLTDSNILVSSRHPTFISAENQQVDAIAGGIGYFTEGMVYARSVVETVYVFNIEQLPLVKNGDRIILKWLEQDGILHTYDMIINSIAPVAPVEQKKCYIVTMCYGVDSVEYREMIFFRDNVLRRYKIGNGIIKVYYRVGGCFAEHLKQNKVAKTISRFILKIILIPVKQWNRRSRNIFRQTHYPA
jgi:hypothetical protein